MSVLDRVRRWLDYDDIEARRIAARSAAVDLDIALAHAEVRAAVQTGATTLRGTVLLKPRDVDRVTRHVMAALKGERPVPSWPAVVTPRDRYWQCTDDCTTDCGACKGGGRPTGEHGDIDAIRRAVQ